MIRRFSYWGWLLALTMAFAAVASVGACGSTGANGTKGTSSASTAGTGGKTGSTSTGAEGGSITSFVGVGGGNGQGLVVEPAMAETLTVTLGKPLPTLKYTATLNGQPTNVSWSVDQGALGTVPAGPASSAVFKASGTTGGMLHVLASQGGKTLQRQIFIKLDAGSQNGPTAAESGQVVSATGTAAQINAALLGGGGVGGVGGEGLGTGYTGFPTTTMPAAMGLKFLYPYDKTVWPRGMLAPLLMWDWAPEDADAIQISLKTTSGSFSWTGTFGPPAVLKAPGSPVTTFIRSPIPQDVWEMATNTAGGPTPANPPDQLVVSLTVAKGGMAYGPITETWNVAPAHLAGTVYYNSYGTALVKNSNGNDAEGNQYGAAVLAIQGGATAPVVVAGPPSDESGSGCRVCHVVAMDGSRLIVQHGDNYARTSSYDLKNANAETVLSNYDNTFGWAGLYPDGSMAFTNAADLAASAPFSQLYAFPPAASGATPLAVTGIPANLQAGAPAFSPDGKHVAFEFLSGTIGTATGNGTQLVVLDFDLATMTFSNLNVLATMTGGERAGFPSFFPTNDAVVFHYQIVNSNHRYNTWSPAQAQIWWSDLPTGTATNLSALNGLDGTTSYLPTNATHPDDTTYNYEPTVNPIVSGGYAWVIFTTRRLYGNLATIQPYLSDPRNYNATLYSNVTCKKLWVAAVDIGSIKNGKFTEGVTPGTDPSHPGFYLPAQELAAGNAHGFWVLDACKADGMSCTTGDQCCNGFCEPGDGGLVCSPPTGSCSGLQEKCTKSADCCDTTNLCINGFCSLGTPPS